MKHTLVAFAVLTLASTALAGINTHIYDIQYPGGPSPYDGQVVTVEGIVYGVYQYGFAIADTAGPWNGIWVYYTGTPMPNVGDFVTVTGTVTEYYEFTEIGTVTSVVVNSTGNTPYPVSIVTCADVGTGSPTAESYEGVFVEVQNALVSDPNLGYGEWMIDDGTGGIRIDDWGTYTYTPVLGDQIHYVQGLLNYSFGDYKIEPRDDDDIVATTGTPTAYTIPQIQGNGFVSPVTGQFVTTSGVVTGFFQGNTPGYGTFEGVFLQDNAGGDGDPATSDGIMAYFPTLTGATFTLGDQIDLFGIVQEFSEYDGGGCPSDCMTVISTDVANVSVSGTGSVTATTFTPPTDTDDEYEYLESLEGMLITIDGNATVVGPTSFGAVSVIDADEGVDHVLRGSAQHGKVVGYRHYERYGDIGGADPDNLIVGSTVNGATGPLMMTYGAFTLITQDGAPWSTVTSVPPPAATPSWPAPTDGTFTIMSQNTYALDVGDTTTLDKLIPLIVDAGCPTFLALQEVDTASTIAGQEDEVLSEIVSRLSAEGCTYSAANSHPDMGDHGVAILWRPDQVVSAVWTDQYQGCSTVGSQSSENYDSYCDAIPDQWPLFSRRPVVLTAQLDATCAGTQPIEVNIIVNHFKSKIGGAEADQRRLEQGQFVGNLVDSIITAGYPHVIVAGDLNDFEDAPPLLALTNAGMLSTWDAVPLEERFSYNYDGVSQALDHVLYTQALSGGRLRDTAPFACNSDFPFEPYSGDGLVPWRASDHDPVLATFLACVDDPLFSDGFESGDTSAWTSTAGGR